jgi:hypothetical protein
MPLEHRLFRPLVAPVLFVEALAAAMWAPRLVILMAIRRHLLVAPVMRAGEGAEGAGEAVARHVALRPGEATADVLEGTHEHVSGHEHGLSVGAEDRLYHARLHMRLHITATATATAAFTGPACTAVALLLLFPLLLLLSRMAGATVARLQLRPMHHAVSRDAIRHQTV